MKHRFALLILFVVCTAVGMNSQDESKKYRVACKEIDGNAARKARSLANRISAENDPAKIDHVITQCRCGLDLLRQQMEEKRELVLQDFKNYYEIDDYDWEWMRHTTTNNHILRQRNKSRFCVDRIGDQAVPECATQLITKELAAHGINTSQVLFSSALEGFSSIYEVRVGIKKAVIDINPSLWEENSIGVKQFISVCAVEELQEKLSLFLAVLKRYWVTVIKPEKQRDSIGFKELKMMTRIIALYSGALRNKQTALLMRKYAKSFDGNHFTSNNYAFISNVTWRWQVLSKTEKSLAQLAEQRIPMVITPRSSGSLLQISRQDLTSDSVLSGFQTTESESDRTGSSSEPEGQETESESDNSWTESESGGSGSEMFDYVDYLD